MPYRKKVCRYKPEETLYATISPANDGYYKWTVEIPIESFEISFGRADGNDYLETNNEHIKDYYIDNHQRRERWCFDGHNTAGFWSRWVSFNMPTLHQSLEDIYQRFNIDVEYIE